MAFENAWHYWKTDFTGGGTDDVDGIDVSETGFVPYSVCRVMKDVGEDVKVEIAYVALESGATADGYDVIMPVAPAGYSGTMRWHRFNDPTYTGTNAPSNPFEGLYWNDIS